MLELEKTQKITMSCIYLHHFLRKIKSTRNIYNLLGLLEQPLHPKYWRKQYWVAKSIADLIYKKKKKNGELIEGTWRQ